MDRADHWHEELDLLKSIILKTGLTETTKWGIPVFTNHNRNIIGISGFKSHFGIWFYNGALLKDDAKVLLNAQEGVTKAMRQWRFSSKEDILRHEALIEKYVREAVANDEAGLSIKPQKKVTVVSDFFQSVLDADESLKVAFDKFSPFKQREFLEYVDSAKREATRQTRLEKVIPMIRDNIGLNDKYR